MLIFSRRPGEGGRIGDDVAFIILDVRGNNVRIGITAPRSIPINREEIYERIKRQINGDADGNVAEPTDPPCT